MIHVRIARRTIGDATAVCRHASPGMSALWMRSLACELPIGMRSPSMSSTDPHWAHAGARFRTSAGTKPPHFTSDARKRYCKNVYRRTRLAMPSSGYIHVEIAMASGWEATSAGMPERPPGVSVPQFTLAYGIDRIGLLKVDIGGSEFVKFGAGEGLDWLERANQIDVEIRRDSENPLAVMYKLERHGFHLNLRDNDGRKVAAISCLLVHANGSRS